MNWRFVLRRYTSSCSHVFSYSVMNEWLVGCVGIILLIGLTLSTTFQDPDASGMLTNPSPEIAGSILLTYCKQ
jgi:hypothetical protein